jgi:alkylation response protein AidB-like acyl-CoA dehydrogenase
MSASSVTIGRACIGWQAQFESGASRQLPVPGDVMVVYAQTKPDGRAGGIAAFVVGCARAGFVVSPRLETGPARGIDAGAFQRHGYRALADELLQVKAHSRAMLSSLA